MQPACVFEVQDGLVVKTNTEEIREIRKTILELLFSEHKARCTICDENGNCTLQNYAYEYQLLEESLGETLSAEPAPNYTADNLALQYDPNKCIRCGRCVALGGPAVPGPALQALLPRVLSQADTRPAATAALPVLLDADRGPVLVPG